MSRIMNIYIYIVLHDVYYEFFCGTFSQMYRVIPMKSHYKVNMRNFLSIWIMDVQIAPDFVTNSSLKISILQFNLLWGFYFHIITTVNIKWTLTSKTKMIFGNLIILYLKCAKYFKEVKYNFDFLTDVLLFVFKSTKQFTFMKE